jgi:hypothetical protein
MNKSILTLFVAGLLAGCTPTNLTQPTFPPVAPEKPKKDSEKPRSSAKADARNPVLPSDVSEQNARQTLRDLNNELERDADDNLTKDD